MIIIIVMIIKLDHFLELLFIESQIDVIKISKIEVFQKFIEAILS